MSSKTSFSELFASSRFRLPILLTFAALGTLQFVGIIVFIPKRLALDPAQWQNPDYANDNAFAYYFVHCILCVAWMLVIGPLLLLYAFQSRWLSLYWSFWFVSALVTAVPLLPVNRSKEIFGTPSYFASGVLGNALQVIIAAVLFFNLFRTPKNQDSKEASVNKNLVDEASQTGIRRIDYLAFHLFCGYNYALFSFKYDLVLESKAALAALFFLILFAHLGLVVFVGFFWEGRKLSPVRQRLSPNPGVLNEIRAYGWPVIFINLAIDIAFLVTSAFFFINRKK